MKNSGNEAKKYLKTKHITFLSGANYPRFACNLVQFEPERSKNSTFCGNEVKASERQGAARQMTKRRLQTTAVASIACVAVG
jgi:hypothetical protein